MEALRRNAKLLAAFFSPTGAANQVSARAVKSARDTSAADTQHRVAEPILHHSLAQREGAAHQSLALQY